MHDYVKGAFEALSWVKELLLEKQDVNVVLKEIEDTLRDIESGVSMDFRRNLRPIRYEMPFFRRLELSTTE